MLNSFNEMSVSSSPGFDGINPSSMKKLKALFVRPRRSLAKGLVASDDLSRLKKINVNMRIMHLSGWFTSQALHESL